MADNGWTDVRDELPANGQRIRFRATGFDTPFEGEFVVGIFFFDRHDIPPQFGKPAVTHWQPLSEVNDDTD